MQANSTNHVYASCAHILNPSCVVLSMILGPGVDAVYMFRHSISISLIQPTLATRCRSFPFNALCHFVVFQLFGTFTLRLSYLFIV